MLRPAPRLATLLLLVLGAAACERRPDLPDPSSPEYAEATSAFYTGVAAVQVGEGGLAEKSLLRAAELAPGEPAVWANLGVVALQQREGDRAEERLEQARRLAPDNARIQLLSALVARERGRADEAAGYLGRAAELAPRDLQVLFLLAQTAEQQGDAGQAQQRLRQILQVRPDNLAALVEHARLVARRGDAGALGRDLDRIQALAGARDSAVAALLRGVRAAASAGDLRRAATDLAFLQTELQRLPAFREDLGALQLSPADPRLVLTRFVRLPAPSARPAPADTGLDLAEGPLQLERQPWGWVRALWLSDEMPLALAAVGDGRLLLQTAPGQGDAYPFPGATGATASAALAPLDFDYDFRVDLALAGRGGLRLLRQGEGGIFADVTDRAIPAAAARGAYAGAWAADLDMEGDMDLVVARVDGPPLVLQNRGDGAFEPRPALETVSRLRDFVWADLDADGDPDAALLDAAGRLHLFANQRSQAPQFVPHPLPAGLGDVRALAAADLDQDALLDLLLLHADGTLRLLSLSEEEWQARTLGRWEGMPAADVEGTRLFTADLDNNGALDVVAATPARSRAWLSTTRGLRLQDDMDAGVTDVADLTDDGRLDLVGLKPGTGPVSLINQGTVEYYSTTLRPRAARTTGDRRINSFGVGGEVEVRSGLLYQKQLIRGPGVHLGLGERKEIDVARIIWPNGSVQAEFDISASNAAVVTRQRLKGSCPWLFAWNGQEMRFVTDFIWRTALGLRINLQGRTAVTHSEDWIRIRGDQLVPRDGFYDLRITAELWETYYFDHVALMAVDHPQGTEVFVDERFVLPAPEPALYTMSPLRPVARARDQDGRDVTAVVRARDERYLDTFQLSPYQGVASDHYVEVELGDDVPASGPLWLVAAGWVYPTDTSINIAFDQGQHPPLRSVQLEVPDGRGGWVVARPDLGFPAGKAKTMLIDLQDVFRPGTPRTLRLRTNMEVYWDQIAWAVSQSGAALRTRRLLPATAELRYRGFSELRPNTRSQPEIPDYRVAGTAPRWRDLVGYYTRFGDVHPLNKSVDDRYIIMNAGDELVLRFPALPPPPPGWTRDFVLIGDGWIKDGDYNTGFSKTVLPLPYHGMEDYDRPPGRLEDDPAYRRHPGDWKQFHTRYVTPQGFQHALVPDRTP